MCMDGLDSVCIFGIYIAVFRTMSFVLLISRPSVLPDSKWGRTEVYTLEAWETLVGVFTVLQLDLHQVAVPYILLNQCLQSNSGLFRPEECCMFFSTFHNDDIELSLILNNSIDKRSRNM